MIRRIYLKMTGPQILASVSSMLCLLIDSVVISRFLGVLPSTGQTALKDCRMMKPRRRKKVSRAFRGTFYTPLVSQPVLRSLTPVFSDGFVIQSFFRVHHLI